MGLPRRALLLGGLAAVVGCAATEPSQQGFAPPSATVPATRTVTLMRHGESIASASGILSTASPGLGLTQTGVDQAQRAASVMAGRGFDGLFSSPLARATQTANVFTSEGGLQVIPVDGLAEITAGAFEGRSAASFGADFLAIVDGWLDGDLETRVPGGESGQAFLARMDAALGEVTGSGARNALVVSHGEAIRCWAGSRILAVNPDDLRLGHTGFLVLSHDSSGWQLVEAQPTP